MSHGCCHAVNKEIDKQEDTSFLYFQKAKINALFTIIFILINIFEIALTPALGLALALMSLMMMYYSGFELYQSAYEALKNKKTNMNSLVALSTIIALVYSVLLCLFPLFFQVVKPHYYFSEIAMILGIVNLGRGCRFKAEFKVKQRTQSSAVLYKKYQPLWAVRIENKKRKRVASKNINIGDIIEIKANQRFPVEGEIVAILNRSKNSWIDEKNITGESQVVKKSIGDSVLSGTRNTKDTIWIRATVKGDQSNLSKLLQSFKVAPQGHASDSPLINTITYYFVPTIMTIALITGGVGLAVATVAITAVPGVLSSMWSLPLCASPCALGLAAMSGPVAVNELLKHHILVKNTNSFEKARALDTIIFDKTGTLTEPTVHSVELGVEFDNRRGGHFLDYVANLEKHHRQSHPIATAIIQKAKSHHYQDYIVHQPVTDEQGMTGIVNNCNITVGSLHFCRTKSAIIDSRYLRRARYLESKGQTIVFIIADGQCVGIIGFKHTIKPQAKEQISALKARGIQVGLLTGDQKRPAQAVAKALGIDEQWVWYQYSASKKLSKIKALKEQGKVVAMVGDGMNDMAACKEADLGFAIHAWTNAAVECDVALQGSIQDITRFLKAATLVNQNIQQNIAWTFFYNTIALMGATGLLYPVLCCAINPVLATSLMALSSIIVIGNAQRLPSLIDSALQEEGSITNNKAVVQNSPPATGVISSSTKLSNDADDECGAFPLSTRVAHQAQRQITKSLFPHHA